jgi:hypothetical protein
MPRQGKAQTKAPLSSRKVDLGSEVCHALEKRVCDVDRKNQSVEEKNVAMVLVKINLSIRDRLSVTLIWKEKRRNQIENRWR